MESFKRVTTVSSLLTPGDYILKIAEARMITSEKDGCTYIALALSTDEGKILSTMISYSGPKLPSGELSELQDQRKIKQRHEFMISLGASPDDAMDVDTLDRNRLPLVEGKSVNVSVNIKTDKKTGFVENNVKQFLPMSG